MILRFQFFLGKHTPAHRRFFQLVWMTFAAGRRQEQKASPRGASIQPAASLRQGGSCLLANVLLAGLLAGCGGPPTDARTPREAQATEEPQRDLGQTDQERAILAQVGELPAGKSLVIDSTRVKAGTIYTAASGHRCRSVSIKNAERTRKRLACHEDDSWFFVPNVMGDAHTTFTP